jgi:hypothetical protein
MRYAERVARIVGLLAELLVRAKCWSEQLKEITYWKIQA